MKVLGDKYQVKLVEPHNHREDTILEIISSLDHLSNITNEIFGSIRARLHFQSEHVTQLTNRAQAAAKHINELKKSQKALRIISPARFPEEDSHQQQQQDGRKKVFNSCFPSLTLSQVPLQKSASEIKRLNGIESSRDRDLPIKNPEELLKNCHVREKDCNGILGSRFEDVGLGFPPFSNSIDSFYLFNSAENPYKDNKIYERYAKDKHAVSGITSRVPRRGEEVQPEDSFNSSKLLSQVDEEENKIDDFYYYPSSVQIPSIDVPDHLPDLPGIATNLDLSPNLEPEQSSSILFSFQRTSLKSSSQSQSSLSNSSNLHLEIPTSSTSLSSTTQNEKVDQSNEQAQKKTSSKEASNTSNPPPAPPPPPPLPVIANNSQPAPTSSSTSDSKKSNQTTTNNNNDRSQLMEAIREAGGGRKLRSAKEIRYEAKKKKQEEKEQEGSSGSVDLISELRHNLALRRRGISGINESQKKAGLGDIMHKLASTIDMLDESKNENSDSAGSDWD